MPERTSEEEDRFQTNFSAWISEAFAASALVNKLMVADKDYRIITPNESDVLTRAVQVSLNEQTDSRTFGRKVISGLPAPALEIEEIQTVCMMLKKYGLDKARGLQLITEFQTKYGVSADIAETILSDFWSNSGPALAPFVEMVGTNS